MTYTWIKQKGRVAILKDGEFDHQQFRGHYAFRNPAGYVADLAKRDAEAAIDAAAANAARLAAAAAYLARRAVRGSAQLNLF